MPIVYIVPLVWLFIQIEPIQLWLIQLNQTYLISKVFVKVLTCLKCLSFWASLTFLTMTNGNLLLAPLAALAAAIIDKFLNQ